MSDIGGGWYLRGDVGVSRYVGGKVKDAYGTKYYDNDFGSGAFAGAGVGYQFSSFFRADVTGEYRFSTGFHFNDRGGAYTTGSYYNPGIGNYQYFYANGTSYEQTKTDFSSAVVLVNGYFDLGTWWGFTPFIGGGVGYAYHFLNNGYTSTQNVYGNYVDFASGAVSPGSPPVGVSGGTIRNKDHGDLAWALYAGIGYDVTPNVKLEVGYRYLNLGTVKTGVIDCYCSQTYSGIKVKDLEAHEVKIGMRWLLGGAVAAPAAIVDAPLITKY